MIQQEKRLEREASEAQGLVSLNQIEAEDKKEPDEINSDEQRGPSNTIYTSFLSERESIKREKKIF